jgi:hypothetical protein
MTSADDKWMELERRLARAEQDVAQTRAQIVVLQGRATGRSRLHRDGILVVLGLGLLLSVSRVLDTQAQGSQPQVLTVKAPFRVVDASGNAILVADAAEGAPRLVVGSAAAGGETLGVGKSGAGFLAVRTAAGKLGTAVGQYQEGGMGVYVLAPDGAAVAASLALDVSTKGRLRVGDDQTGGASIGVGKSGAGFVVVRRPDGRTGVDIGQLEGRPMALSVFGDNQKALVSLRTDQKGGSVEVMTATGTTVGGLLASDTGGGLALTGPAGGKSAVSLSVSGYGGVVRVFPQGGGTAQAEFTTSAAGGAITAYNGTGAPIAMVGSKDGKGYFELNDPSGTKMVEAGSTKNSKGYVLVTPWQVSTDMKGDPSVLKGGGK